MVSHPEGNVEARSSAPGMPTNKGQPAGPCARVPRPSALLRAALRSPPAAPVASEQQPGAPPRTAPALQQPCLREQGGAETSPHPHLKSFAWELQGGRSQRLQPLSRGGEAREINPATHRGARQAAVFSRLGASVTTPSSDSPRSLFSGYFFTRLLPLSNW